MRRLAIITIALLTRTGAADPALGRVLAAPTAWLPERGVVIGTGDVDHHGETAIDFVYGLGGIASVELGRDEEVRVAGAATHENRAVFRIGARQDEWFAGQPALVLGVSKSFASDVRVAHAYVVASRVLGPIAVHVGADMLAATNTTAVIRPLAGLELVPPQYPRTTLIADLAWLPLVSASSPTEWLLGWGVRYQALTWGSIELDVRHREGEDLGASTVMVRVHGVWTTR
jgi:hypothetical protein